jgi:hypothetical protein
MRQFVLGALFIAAGLSSPAMAGALDEQPVTMPSPYRPLSSGSNLSNFIAKPQLRPMAHRWGFGLDTIPGASVNPLSGSLVSEPNAIAIRWWATDRLGLDLLGAANVSSLNGTTGSSTATNPGGQTFGVGVGVKYNLTEPSHDLLAQLVARGSYATAEQTGATSQLSTTALFVGAGFEAFVPGWDWLSLEGSAGLTLNSQDLEPANGASGASQSTSNVSLGGNGFSPVDLSIHVYF